MSEPPSAAARASDTYEVTAVRYGTRATHKSDVFLHYGIYGEPDEPIEMDYFFWVARRPGRTVLIDCGFSERGGARRNRTTLCPPAQALSRLGIDPGSVSKLIVTHAHYDHIGNLAAFPSVEIVMSRREYDFWTGPLASRPLFATSAEEGEIAALRQARAEQRIRFAGERGTRQPAVPGIDVLEVGGHTPGQLVVLVSAAGGEVVLASDALHYYEEMERDRPFAHVADLPEMYAGFETLRQLAAPGRPVIAGHDPDVMRRFPALDGDAAGLAVSVGCEVTR